MNGKDDGVRSSSLVFILESWTRCVQKESEIEQLVKRTSEGSHSYGVAFEVLRKLRRLRI
jgi:hypothetical protein